MISKNSSFLKSLLLSLVLTGVVINNEVIATETAQPSNQSQTQTSAQADRLVKFRALAKSNPAEALRQIDSAISVQPSNPELQKFRWYLAELTGHNVEVLGKQRSDFDKCHDLWLGKFHTTCLYLSEHIVDCRQMARLLADTHPSDESVICLNAWVVATYSGDYKKALSDVRTLLSKQKNPRLLGWQALLLGLMGELTQARSLFEHDEPSCSNSVSWQLSKYTLYMQMPETDHFARAAYARIRVLKLSLVEDLQERATRLLFLGSTPQNRRLIERDWLEANKLDSVPEMAVPRLTELQLMIAIDDGNEKRIRQSLEKLRGYRNWHALFHIAYTQAASPSLWSKSIALNPGQSASYCILAERARDWKTKLDIYSKHAIKQRRLYATNGRAGLLETAGEFKAAERDWALSYEYQPGNNLAILRHLCMCKARVDKAAAISFIESECKRHPEDLRLRIVKAETLLACGDCEAAEKTIGSIRTMAYPTTEKAILLGNYMERRGYLDEALKIYKKALVDKADPTSIHLAIASAFYSAKPKICLDSCNWLYMRHPENGAEKSAAIYYSYLACNTQNKKKEALAQIALGIKCFPRDSNWDYNMLGMMTESDLETAKALYTKGIRMYPMQRQYYNYHYAVYLTRCKRIDEAIKLYEEAIKAPGPLREQWQCEAELLDRTGRTQQAIAKLTEGIALTESASLYVARSAIFRKLKKYVEAVRDADTAMDRLCLTPVDVYSNSLFNSALCERTAVCDTTNNTKKALELLEIGLMFSPGNPFWMDSIFPRLQASDREKARTLYERWRAYQPVAYDVCYATYLTRNHFAKEALAIFEMVNKQTPDNFECRKSTAALAVETDQLDLALKELTYICTKLKPNDEWSWTQKINILKKLGRNEEAAATIDQAIAATNNTSPTLCLMRNQLHGHRADSIEDVTRICHQNPGATDAWATLSDMMPTPREKRRILDEALKHNPNSTDLLLKRVDLCVEDEPTVSLSDINRLMKLGDHSNIVKIKKADTLQSLGRHREAVEMYRVLCREVADLYPKKLVSAMLSAGMYAEALQECDQVLSTEPNNIIAWELKLCALNLMGRTSEFESGLTTVAKFTNTLTRSKIKLTCLLKYQQAEVSEFISVIKEAKNETADRKATLKKLVDREVDFAKRTKYLLELAEIATARGQYKEAIDYYNKALLCEPSNYRLYLKRAAAYNGERDFVRSKQDRMQALELFRKFGAEATSSTK